MYLPSEVVVPPDMVASSLVAMMPAAGRRTSAPSTFSLAPPDLSCGGPKTLDMTVGLKACTLARPILKPSLAPAAGQMLAAGDGDKTAGKQAKVDVKIRKD